MDDAMKDMTVLEVARSLMPDATDQELEHIIWGATGFPVFWRTDKPSEEFFEQLQAAAEMRKNGTLDDHIRKAWTLDDKAKGA